MQFLGTDSDFGSIAKFKSVSETCGRIVIDGCCIHIMHKALCMGCIPRYDTLGMFGSVMCDVLHRFVQVLDNTDI
ncbi:hypothetical protein D3C76_1467520 [compost metagenome]